MVFWSGLQVSRFLKLFLILYCEVSVWLNCLLVVPNNEPCCKLPKQVRHCGFPVFFLFCFALFFCFQHYPNYTSLPCPVNSVFPLLIFGQLCYEMIAMADYKILLIPFIKGEKTPSEWVSVFLVGCSC